MGEGGGREKEGRTERGREGGTVLSSCWLSHSVSPHHEVTESYVVVEADLTGWNSSGRQHLMEEREREREGIGKNGGVKRVREERGQRRRERRKRRKRRRRGKGERGRYHAHLL